MSTSEPQQLDPVKEKTLGSHNRSMERLAQAYQESAQSASNSVAIHLLWLMNPSLSPEKVQGRFWMAKQAQETAADKSRMARAILIALIEGV